MSRSTKIKILLAIDVVFFFVELISGYAVGSLALIADSFHMLNDVMSLIVALYAIKLTEKSESDSRYSYGWHRAEILAALINGVFLLALCFSIFLEALERFVNTPDISNPRLVVIVGALGLASNIVGLFLFHEHSHSHSHSHSHVEAPKTTQRPPTRTRSVSEASESFSGHPVVTRAQIVKVANDIARSNSPARSHSHTRHFSHDERPTEITPLIEPDHHDHDHDHEHSPSSGHSHSHAGSMNMRALVLHVLGDALGNVGVIATGLVIWQTSWSFKYYFDPLISIVITMIIFSSALPLVRSASFVLLQGVPSTISFDEVRSAILAVDGVLSLHELHIWQLSESKNVASVHVMSKPESDFMSIASKIRKALHDHGIHSCTIQPEYYRAEPHNGNGTVQPARDLETSCLVLCPPDACNPQDSACCPPPSAGV
ncbi:Cation efflux protein [Mycena kentingensis (nom. inval.)]|nr:Cation efflux protein [Mycena kentingensis (nom. inval.)]